jgi:hypothetical protein
VASQTVGYAPSSKLELAASPQPSPPVVISARVAHITVLGTFSPNHGRQDLWYERTCVHGAELATRWKKT